MITILCIDDEREIRELLAEEFEDSGLNVIQASNGREGLEKILAHTPDIVVCDISMPEMNGHEVMAAVRMNHPELANMPIILLSALTDRHNTLQGLSAGADDYLSKPIDLDLLMAKISGCIMMLENRKSLVF